MDKFNKTCHAVPLFVKWENCTLFCFCLTSAVESIRL
uniref:Uncharacterized protein n=1 Tax=Anguilla anguilla TaxID=7936 RepID=A0A0E9PNA7_ANGAN